eukprot:jgi/Tetstr1/428832/TSEL_018819.t1
MATVRDAAFIGCMNAILPRFLTRNSGTNTPTLGFFDPQLGSVLGRGSFNANSSARQYDHFLNDAHGSDSYAVEMREAWGRLQAATAGHLGDADARQMEREVEAASGSQKELTAFLDQANNSRLRNEVCALPATCRERILFNQLDAASGMWTVAIPTARTAMTLHELREVAAGYFFLPSPCLAPVVGCQIILPSTEHNPVIVDLYGDALMNLPAPGDAHWRVQHDAIADAFRDHCVHDLGIAVRREVDDLFQQAVPLGNTVPRDELKDLVPDAELSLPVFNVVTGSYDPRSLKSTLLEFKTMRYGVKYTSVPRATAVDRFERSLLGDIQRGLAARDAAWHNTEPGQKGPLRDILDMSEYTGMVFGTVERLPCLPGRVLRLAAMEVDPIYCAEQIVIPHDLADILKAYTKEVIRRQPEDLHEFSAIYFANLFNVSQGMDEYLPPNVDQLKHIYDTVQESDVLHTDQLVEQCLDAGISKATLDKVFVLGNLGRDSMVQPSEFLVLLLTMTNDSFSAVVQGLFDVFGDTSGTLPTEEFLKLYECLSVWDSDVSEKAVQLLKATLSETPTVTFAALGQNEIIREKLAV